jgi:asparagine synthase (glutamine-hydrolysing)
LWGILWPFGFANLVPAWLQGGLRTLLRRGYAAWQKQGYATIAPWVKPDFSRRYALHSRIVAHLGRFDTVRPAGLAAALTALALKVGDPARWLLTAPHGMTTAHPFLDTRLVRYCLGVHVHMKPIAERQKPILADALRGTLPDEIRHRPSKCCFNEAYFIGLRRNLPRLEALVRHASGLAQDWLDGDELLRCLRQTALGVSPNAIGTDRLGLTLSLLLWLARHDEWQRRPMRVARELCWSEPNQLAAAGPSCNTRPCCLA